MPRLVAECQTAPRHFRTNLAVENFLDLGDIVETMGKSHELGMTAPIRFLAKIEYSQRHSKLERERVVFSPSHYSDRIFILAEVEGCRGADQTKIPGQPLDPLAHSTRGYNQIVEQRERSDGS